MQERVVEPVELGRQYPLTTGVACAEQPQVLLLPDVC
jgi:hypothetical protein